MMANGNYAPRSWKTMVLRWNFFVNNYCVTETKTVRQTQLCCKYIQKMSQNDHPINFLIPKTAPSGHSYNLWPVDNNRNIVYAERRSCRTQHSGSFISFVSKYVDM